MNRPRRWRAPPRASHGPAAGAALSIAFAIALAFTVLLAGGPIPTATGAEVKRGDRIVVPATQRIDDDLYIVANRAEIDGAVNGDVVAATVALNVVGSISGDLLATSGRAEVRGRVGGDVQALGASIAIYGEVAGDVVVVGGSITIVEGATVAGDLIVAGGSVSIVRDASVAGEVRGAALKVDIEGRIADDVRLTVRRLHIASGARVEGALHYRSDIDARIDPGAIVDGPIERSDPAGLLPFGTVMLWANGALFRLLAMLTAGSALVLLIPRGTVATANRCRAMPIEALLVGSALAVILPLSLILAALTILGLPIALIGAATVASALYLSEAVVGLALGRVVLRIPAGNARRGPNLAAMAVGIVGFTGVRLVPVDGIGIFVPLGIAIFGLGAITLGLYRGDFVPSTDHASVDGRSGDAGAEEIGGRKSRSDQSTTPRDEIPPRQRVGTRSQRGLRTVVVGYLSGFLGAVAATIAVGAAAIWLVDVVLSLGTSSSLTLAVERDHLALAAIAASAIAVGTGAYAMRIYRRL